MGKISDYANVLKSKLTDLFVVYQRNDGELETKNATLEQLGDAICGEQVHADLETNDKTIIGGINENKDKVGDLSTLTTTDKSSLVGAVNEVNTGLGTKAKITRKKYSVTLTSNSYLAPFTYFNRLDVGSDTLLYGAPIGVWANNAGVTPHIENSNSVDFLGGSAITCDVYVFFASNVDVIS